MPGGNIAGGPAMNGGVNVVGSNWNPQIGRPAA